MEHPDYIVHEITSTLNSDSIDWGTHTVHAPCVWGVSTGIGVKVAVLDTGIDHEHADLKENVKAYIDFTGSPYGALDKKGHGTHVAGIIAAADNGVGIVGIAPQVEIYSAKVLPETGSSSYDSIIKAIRWAVALKVDIINMSFGGSTEPPKELHDAIKEAHAEGIIMAAATGNQNTKVCWPARYDEVIAVAAMNKERERASFSNYGPDYEVEVAAPGVDIYSTFMDGGYAKLSGTSMATPAVVGCVALYVGLAKSKGLPRPTLEEIRQRLDETCETLSKNGKDQYTGAGLINIEKMIP